MNALTFVARALLVPSALLLGACACQNDIVGSDTAPAGESADGKAAVAQMADIRFDFNKSAITEGELGRMKANAEWMTANPAAKVLIEGHCDERGTSEYNMALGERRAVSAKECLGSLGVSPDRLRTVSFGEEQPLDTAHTEEAWARNRRAHFVAR